MRKIAFYHKDCSDGTMSAAVFLRKYPNAITIPVSHKDTLEEIQEICAGLDSGSDVYTLDSAIHVDYLIENFSSVTTYDHHISIKETCEKLDELHHQYTFVFDNNKSGATLTWSQLFPEEEMPVLLTYVQDVDLYTKKYGEVSIAAISYIYLYVNEPEKFLEFLDFDVHEIVERGRILMMQNELSIEKMMKRDPIKIVIGGYLVNAYNVGELQSFFGNQSSDKTGSASLMYTVKGGTTTISLRSIEGQSPTALDIATVLGGGGHKHASGAAVPTKDFLKMLSEGIES